MAADGGRAPSQRSTQPSPRQDGQEWPSTHDSEKSDGQGFLATWDDDASQSRKGSKAESLGKLLAALKKSGSAASGAQVAEVLEVIIDNYDSQLKAQQHVIKSQQEEIVKIHRHTAQNREHIMSIVDQTNTKLKEHLTKLNDKVKKIKRDNTTHSLYKSRTSSMNRATTRGSTMALGPTTSGDQGVSFSVKDSVDSQGTSQFDDSPTKKSNPFRITGTQETDDFDDEEPNNRPPSTEGDGEYTFDIDAPEEQAIDAAGSHGSKNTPAPEVIGRGHIEDQAAPSPSHRGMHLGGLGTLSAGLGGLTAGGLVDGARHMVDGGRHLAEQMAEEAMGVVRVPTMMSTLSSEDEMDGHMMHEGKLIAVTANMLDKGDMYRSNSSVWDAMFFVLIPAVGPSCSVLVSICWVLNILLQLAFIYIVEVMLADDLGIDPDTLQGLLQFRLGAAHHADFADRVSQQSMAAQVCNEESRLHLAGGQQDLYSNISKFGGTNAWLAEGLVMLIQFLWASTVLRDVNNTVTIFRGLKGILRSRKSTRLFLADLQDSDDDDDKDEEMVKTKSKKDADTPDELRVTSKDSRASRWKQKSGTFLRSLIEQDHGQDEDEVAQSNLVSIMKVVRWTRIWYGRFYLVCFTVCLPKIVLAGALWWVGAKWLAHTISLTELILNGVALAFVLDFDECLFDIFVPRRVKILVNNLEPLPLTRNARQGTQVSVINSTLKIGGAFLVLMGLYLWINPLIFWQLRQADMIMCQGETDFIYTVNPATGLVHVAKTPTGKDWTQSEYTIAGVAKPPLLDEHNSHWESTDVTSEMFRHASSDSSMAVFEPRASSYEAAVASDDSFKRIIQMSVWSVADAAASLPCEDLAKNLNVEAAKTELRLLTGISDLKDCSDVPVEKCSDLNMYQLRAICPKTCECDATHLSATGSGRAGFFAAPEFGCPTQCSTFRAAENEIRFRFDMASQWFWFFTRCDDTDPDEFFFPGNCSSSNRNGQGIVTSDNSLWDCDLYERVIRHGSLSDDENICDPESNPYPYVADDVDFTAMDMCCVCGGGQYNVKSSAECWDAWDPDCTDMPRDKLAWLRYVQGLFQYLYSRPGFEDGVRNVLQEDVPGINASEQEQEVIVHTITLGWFFRMLATSNNWEIAPGVPHPRGLTGCDFLASYEITALLNIDLCNPSVGTSIKFFCPSACQCTEASLLSECPAACVFPGCSWDCKHVHPWYGGADPFDSSSDATPAPITDPSIYNASICHNSLAAEGATDANGDRCQDLFFDNERNCSADDDDFTASEMCCACSGGSAIGGVEFTILVLGMDLDSLSMAQRSNVTSTLKYLVLQAVLGTGRSPSSTIDDVQMELHNGSIIAPTRVYFSQQYTTALLHLIVTDLRDVMSGPNFTSSVADAICLIDGLENYTSQLTVYRYGQIMYGGVDEGSPLSVPSIDLNHSESPCTGCDCTQSLDAMGWSCAVYSLTSAIDTLSIVCHNEDRNDEDFTALDMCCACEGIPRYDVLFPCLDTAGGAQDGVNEGCGVRTWNEEGENWTYTPMYECDANFDDSDFTASDMCCECGGGDNSDYPIWDACVNDDDGETLTDSSNNKCRLWSLWADQNSEWVDGECEASRNSESSYDDSDFTLSEMCCVCGGGYNPVGSRRS